MAIINITVDTTTESAAFLAALFGVLAGRFDKEAGGISPALDTGTPLVARALPVTPQEAADALMAHAVATRAPVPLPPVTEDEGDEANPTQLDSSGIPWDARIHSTPPKINKTGGLWRAKRGVDEVTFGQVVGELQERFAGNPPTGTNPNGPAGSVGNIAPTPPVSAPVAPTPSAPSVAPPPAANGAPSAGSPPVDAAPLAPPPTVAESAPAAPAAPTVAAAASGDGRFATFAAFVQAVSGVRSPPIPYVELNDYAAQCGVAGGFKDMKDHPELFEMFYGLAGGQ